MRVTVIKKERLAGGFNSVDQAFVICVLCEAVCFSLQYMNSDALINQFGFLIDFLGGYLLVRYLIQDEADIYRAAKSLAVLTVILAVGMVIEQAIRQNLFGLLVGVSITPEIREGRIRSQATFSHSLTAGTFAATLLPLFFLLWKNAKAKVIAVVGMLGCTVMTICSNSSTPLLAYVGGIFAMCLWPIRRKMRTLRWGLVIALVILNFVMKAPVWFLIAHIDLTGGSSGYQRAQLIDQFIRHFSDWWLIGSKEVSTWGFDMWDTQNQYVNVGETGGLLALGYFIAVISRALARVGNARRLVEGESDELSVWFLAAAMFAYLVGFFGINCFDQIRIGWFLVLAMISAATAPLLQAQSVESYGEAESVVDGGASLLHLQPGTDFEVPALSGPGTI